ncbi:MAG: hypothetical protein MK214_19960 [Thalassotalea sp.]|nr:hypothetical protein [Thalassotalea sp.]
MEDKGKDKNQESLDTEATALVEMIESERFEEVLTQLEDLKTKPFASIRNYIVILAIGYFFIFLPQNETMPDFYYLALVVILITSLGSSESYRANKRIDLIVKLLKMKRPTK